MSYTLNCFNGEKSTPSENTQSKKEYLLITHLESGDEIHFTIIDYSFYNEINNIIGEDPRTLDMDSLLKLIYDNIVESLMCQSYVLEDYSIISKYNIVKAIHLPELGC